MESKLTVEEIKKFATMLTLNGGRTVGKTIQLRMSNELLEYKQIEQELGIELSVLFKKPYCTIYIIKDYGTFKRIEEHTLYSIIPQEKCIVVTFDNTKFYWKDYGKTWALTKEELEK